MRALAVLPALLLATPAFAETVMCENMDGSTRVMLEIAFDGERDGGAVLSVEALNEDLTLSTTGEETLAFADIAYDRLQIGLESPGVGPMTMTLDVIRGATYDGAGGPDTDVVAVGILAGYSFRPTIVECWGW